MGKHRIDWPVEQIRHWIEIEKRTHKWVAEQICDKLGVTAKKPEKLIQKICKKHSIITQKTGPRPGRLHPEWKGGRLIDKSGYILVYCPGHPFARAPKKKYVLEHRLVMEKHLGRFLQRNEVVHHINGNKSDNRLKNLKLFSSNGQHLKIELSGKIPKWTEQGIKEIASACVRGLQKCNHNYLKLDEKELIRKLTHQINEFHKVDHSP